MSLRTGEESENHASVDTDHDLWDRGEQILLLVIFGALIALASYQSWKAANEAVPSTATSSHATN